MDHRVLIVVLSLWSSGYPLGYIPRLQAEENDTFKGIDEILLSGGSSHCSGEILMKQQGVLTEMDNDNWDLKLANAVCSHLNCGSVVSVTTRYHRILGPLPAIPSCIEIGDRQIHCMKKRSISIRLSLEILCSDSVRLVNGTSLCSGRLEVKFNQSNQTWSSVCDDDFYLQDAEVVCRELGCGAPSLFKGGLYGEVEAPVWNKEFQCGGNESALLDCRSSGSDRNTCSPGEAVGLTCSEPDYIQLVGGSSRCAGKLMMNLEGERRPVYATMPEWNMNTADIICRQLDCGSVVSIRRKKRNHYFNVWMIGSTCLQSKSSLRECVLRKTSEMSLFILMIKCSDSVRLVNGTSLCSGRLEVKSNQTNQSWSSMCEADFDQLDAQVVCRELGCGAPSVLQGTFYGEGEAPTWSKDFQCGGNESALLDCRSSGSDRKTCSSGKAVGLTCSEADDVRLVGGTNHCVGKLEMKYRGEWRPLAESFYKWDQMLAAVVCRQLDCGSALSIERADEPSHPSWMVSSSCGQSESALRQCAILWSGRSSKCLEVTCSEFLAQPKIFFATLTDGFSEATQHRYQVLLGSQFAISCFILPQLPGGFFQLHLTTSATAHNFTVPAVNHSAHFLFRDAGSTHQGEYRCVYHLHVFSHMLSSESQPLLLTVSDSVTHLIIRLVVLVLMVVFSAAVFYKVNRGLKPRREEMIGLNHLGGAEDLLSEGAGAQETE